MRNKPFWGKRKECKGCQHQYIKMMAGRKSKLCNNKEMVTCPLWRSS